MPQIHPGIRQNWFYGTVANCDGTYMADVQQDQLVFQLFLSPSSLTINRIGMEVLSPASSGGKGRLGIYYNNDLEGAPSTLLLGAGEVPVDTVGWKEIAVNLTLNPGWYWISFVTSSVVGVQGKGNSEVEGHLVGFPDSYSGAYVTYIDHVYSPLPTEIILSDIKTYSDKIPFLHMRRV